VATGRVPSPAVPAAGPVVVPGTVKLLQLKREHRRWYVIVITDTGAEPLPATGRAAGVDVGVARFLTTSDGQVIANPRFLAALRSRCL